MTRICIITVAAFIFTGCKPELDQAQLGWGNQNFTRVVCVGDGYIAGFQDGALSLSGQQYSIPALLNESFNMVRSTEFGQPTMPYGNGLGYNSKPWESDFVNASNMGWRTDCEGEVSLGPVKTSFNFSDTETNQYTTNVSGYFSNFGIPLAKSSDLYSPMLNYDFTTPGGNLYFNRMTTAPNSGTSTVLDEAANANGTFSVVWTGMEDILDYAKYGGYNRTIASAAQFASNLDSIYAHLPTGVILNIPNVESLPYFTTIPWNGANLTQAKADSITDLYDLGGMPHIVFNEGDNPFVIEDINEPSGFRQLLSNEMITIRVPLDSMKCQFMGILFSAVPDQYVLDTAEIAYLNIMIEAYNTVIAQKAIQYNLCLVDMNSYLQSVESGIQWNGVDFDMEFVSGGYYSLDGIHPNQKGYALITNQIIIAINEFYGANLSTLTCPDCNGILFP